MFFHRSVSSSAATEELCPVAAEQTLKYLLSLAFTDNNTVCNLLKLHGSLQEKPDYFGIKSNFEAFQRKNVTEAESKYCKYSERQQQQKPSRYQVKTSQTPR